MGKSKVKVIISILAVALSASLFATSIGRVNLAGLVLIADRIFLGTCLQANPRVDPASGVRYVEYVFEVQDGLKGVTEGQKVSFNQVLTDDSSSLPQFQVGEERVLFLHPDSRLGFTSPVGFFQGSFAVGRTETGRRILTNRISNLNLAAGMSPAERTILEESRRQSTLSDNSLDLEILRRYIQNVSGEGVSEGARQ